MIMVEGNRAKRTVKDSVFTNLFGDSKYLLQFYQAIHPEDKDVKEDDLQTVTLENILTDGIYNDLGFIKDDKIMILAEAQSTWTSNIIIRALEYLVNSYRRYFLENDMDLYKSKKVRLPKPELYVIYTGNRKNRPEKITLTNEFFHGEETAIEVTVKMIYDGKKGDIIIECSIYQNPECTDKITWRNEDCNIRNDPYLQEQRCFERILGR